MLSYIQINAAKPREKAWTLSDSQSLYLVIQPNGSKLWRFNYRFLDKQKKLHLGGWPTISLAEARVRRDEAKRKIAEGIDPALEKKRARIAAKFAAANTFQAVAEEWLVKCERDGLAPVKRGDIVRLMQRELTARRLDRAGVEQVVTTTLSEPIVGRMIHRGFSDEHRDRHYLMIDGTDGRVHYVDVGRGDGTPSVPEGATIRIEPTKLSATQADRTVAAIARANGGRYSVDLHLAHDPSASEAFATSHVRRLEAMRRAGAGPERLADGSWEISDDHLAQAEAFAQRQQRDRPVTLSVLSRTPLAELPSRDAPTWLDREIEGAAHAPRDIGFGREVRTALAARRQWLIEQRLASEERGTFRLRDGAMSALRQRELHDTAKGLADRLGKSFEPPRMGERIEGVIARRVDLESGSYAVVERSRDFTLVPWRDVLQRNIGKTAAGVMRTDGISWQIGRGRSGPTLS